MECYGKIDGNHFRGKFWQSNACVFTNIILTLVTQLFSGCIISYLSRKLWETLWRKIILYLPRDGGKKTLYLPLMFNNFFSNSSSFIVVILYLFEHIKGKGNPVKFCVFVYKYLKINLRSPTPHLFFILFIDIF